MTILCMRDSDGGFTVVDTTTRRTAYAYPTSTHATEAKHRPVAVAKRMMRAENTMGAWRDTVRYAAQDAERIERVSREGIAVA